VFVLKLSIHGIGIVNGYGSHLSDLGQAYTDDIRSIKEQSEVPGDGDGIFKLCADTASLSQYLAKGKLRRIDHYSRMALLAAGKAIQDADPTVFVKKKTGVIVASGYGALNTTFAFLDSYIDNRDGLASPTHFSNSVHNAAAAHISIGYGIEGPSITVSQFDMSFISALLSAAMLLEQGNVDSVLIGTADEYCDVLGYCIHGLSKDKKKYSFSEGAAFFLLKAQKEGKSKYGWFEDITMGNYEKDTILIPEDCDLIVGSSTNLAMEDFFEQSGLSHLSSEKKIRYRKQCFSPTDSSMDAAYSVHASKKICYIKLGQGKEYGKIIIHPKLN
jgi:3-oxoacyl-[acyl-carrier-protein] synthase II